MFQRRFRRSRQKRLLRATFLLVSAVLLFDALSLLKDYRRFSENLIEHTYTDVSTLPSPAQGQKIFICAQFWTNAMVIEKRWGAALLKLIETLGAENVYVSIYESGSLDNTKEMLQYLDSRLEVYHIRRTITLDPSTHADEIAAGPVDEHGNPRSGWVQPPSPATEKEVRRIPFLARARNLSLKPLFEEQKRGRTYDRILFLNDVVFQPSDVLSLLATNQGSYAAACALDYHYPASLATYYDTFVLRDTNGDRTARVQFPYFRGAESRQAILRGTPARVRSCWNGMVLMDASSFYDDAVTGSEGLRFRGIPDSLASKHLEGSECCLIHEDLVAMSAAGRGIYVNPAVRVGYTETAYNLTHFGSDQTFITPTQYVRGMWLSRFARMGTSAKAEMRDINKRLDEWKSEAAASLEKRDNVGAMCLIDEMHLLIWNGWKHV